MKKVTEIKKSLSQAQLVSKTETQRPPVRVNDFISNNISL